jgi:hypothetical protein
MIRARAWAWAWGVALAAPEDRSRPEPLPIRAFYTVPELAKASSLSRPRTLRILRKLGVRMVRLDRHWLVPLDELERKGQPFWAAVRAAELRRVCS